MAIMPWVLVLTLLQDSMIAIEFPGETACKTALKIAVNAERVGKDRSHSGGMYGFCLPKGEPDYAKMGK